MPIAAPTAVSSIRSTNVWTLNCPISPYRTASTAVIHNASLDLPGSAGTAMGVATIRTSSSVMIPPRFIGSSRPRSMRCATALRPSSSRHDPVRLRTGRRGR
jgi:hypothetical protein